MINKEDENLDNLDNDPDEQAEITDQELQLLDNAGSGQADDEWVQRAHLDDVDEDGTPLNEESSTSAMSGSDLDIPGSELDDTNEEIGEEDEENNGYSLGDN